MKKSTIILGLAAILSLSLASCTKEHASNQKVTVYPSIEILKGTTYPHQVGTDWVEPGFVATLAGVDVTDEIVVSDNVDAYTSGVYEQTYTYTNVDGFEVSASRKVVVYDIVNAGDADITGTYTTLWNREAAGDVAAKTWAGQKDKKIENGPAKGLFYVQDIICGFYEDYCDYGAAYAFKTLILLGKDNKSISILTNEDPAWGYAIQDKGGSNYDDTEGVIKLNWYWDGWGTNIETVYTLKK